MQALSKTQRLTLNTLVFWIGGAGAQFLTLWALSLFFSKDRVADGGVATTVLIATVIAATFLWYVLKRFFLGTTACMLAVLWWSSCFVVTLLAAAFFSAEKGMPLVAYLLIWLLVGLLAAFATRTSAGFQRRVAAGAAAAGAGAYVATRQQQTVMKSSGYGRIPPATVILLSQHVRTANNAANRLPQQVSPPFRTAAIGIVLDYLVKDWWYNENREGLTPTDEGDLGAFVQLAWSVCRVGPQSAEEAVGVFKAVLNGLMDDWFQSWNDEVDGAPRWQYS